MDIYNYINSKAISSHCREIEHQFTPLEMAYIINASESVNIRQKHTAYKEIIAGYPDMEVPERNWTPHFDSLHTFLEKYMKIENKYISVFYEKDTECVYSFKVRLSGDEDYTEDDRLFRDFDTCYSALKFDIDDLVAAYGESDIEIIPLSIIVRKQWFNKEKDERAKAISVLIDYNNIPIGIWDDYSVISSEEKDVLNAFEGMWIEIPTPFKKGDILVARNDCRREKEPFVLDSLPYWIDEEGDERIVSYLRENGDQSDLCTSIFGQDEDGSVWRDHGPSYLDLEYCKKELCGVKKILIAVSNFVKGNLPLELMIRSYDILKREQYAKKERFSVSCFYDELLKRAGLMDETADTDTNCIDDSDEAVEIGSFDLN